MNYLGLMISFAFVLTGTFMLSGCNANQFDADKLVIVDEFTYDGNSHVLEISYEDVDLDVTFSTTKDGEFKPGSAFNFKDADTYELFYKISADGYNDYESSEAMKFEIKKKPITIQVENVIKMVADRSQAGYELIAPETNADELIIGEDDLNLTYTIGNKVGTQIAFVSGHVMAGDRYNIVGRYDNDNYDVNFTQGYVEIKDYVEVAKHDGNKVYYSTLDRTTIFSNIDKGSVITLYKDFAYDAGATSEYDIRLMAENGTDYQFTFDLNGHAIDYRMTFTNRVSGTTFTTGKINVTVKNGSIGKSTITEYGFTVFGNTDVQVTLEDLQIIGKDYGFSGNGYCEGATLIAEDCSFTGGTAGAYAPSKYTYRFTSCNFAGATAYYAKSGNHTLTSCQFVGNQQTYEEPKYNGNGTYTTGSAIVIDSAQGYFVPMKVELNKCSFISISGYCIEEFATASANGQEECYAEIAVTDANFMMTGRSKAVFSESHTTGTPIITGVSSKYLLIPTASA